MFDEPKTFADRGIFEPNSIINYLDLFSSERLSIIKCCEERFFTGNPSDVIQVGTYFAYNAHNAYVQIIYEYSYIAGSAFILCLLTNTVAGMHQYIKTKSVFYFSSAVMMVMTLGLFMGERVNLYTPEIIIILMFSYPVIIKMPEPRSKKMKSRR